LRSRIDRVPPSSVIASCPPAVTAYFVGLALFVAAGVYFLSVADLPPEFWEAMDSYPRPFLDF